MATIFRSISPKFVIEYLRNVCSVSKYYSIIDSRIGLAVPLNTMQAEQPEIRIRDVRRSNRSEYQPKHPIVTSFA